jgi:hypothetical protein
LSVFPDRYDRFQSALDEGGRRWIEERILKQLAGELAGVFQHEQTPHKPISRERGKLCSKRAAEKLVFRMLFNKRRRGRRNCKRLVNRIASKSAML